jgi:hypothetical protein
VDRLRRDRVSNALRTLERIEQAASPKKDKKRPPAQANEPAAADATSQDGAASKDKPPKTVRVSTTDADARVMKMADGGFRPAFNAQLAVDTATQIITAVALDNVGSDIRSSIKWSGSSRPIDRRMVPGPMPACANAASSMRKCVVDARWITYVHRIVVNAHPEKRIGCSAWATNCVVEGGDTGLYFVTHGERDHEFTYRRAGSAAARMTPQSLPLQRVADAQFLHVSGISQAISASARETVAQAITIARANGTRVSYDLNFRPRLWSAQEALAALRETLAQCDLFFPSVDEIEQLTGLRDPDEIIRRPHEQGRGRWR